MLRSEPQPQPAAEVQELDPGAADRVLAVQDPERFRQDCIGEALRACNDRGIRMTYKPRSTPRAPGRQ